MCESGFMPYIRWEIRTAEGLFGLIKERMKQNKGIKKRTSTHNNNTDTQNKKEKSNLLSNDGSQNGLIEMKEGSLFETFPSSNENSNENDHKEVEEEEEEKGKGSSIAKRMLGRIRRLSSNTSSSLPPTYEMMNPLFEEEPQSPTAGGMLLDKGGTSSSVLEFQLEFALVTNS